MLFRATSTYLPRLNSTLHHSTYNQSKNKRARNREFIIECNK